MVIHWQKLCFFLRFKILDRSYLCCFSEMTIIFQPNNYIIYSFCLFFVYMCDEGCCFPAKEKISVRVPFSAYSIPFSIFYSSFLPTSILAVYFFLFWVEHIHIYTHTDTRIEHAMRQQHENVEKRGGAKKKKTLNTQTTAIGTVFFQNLFIIIFLALAYV